MITQIDDDLFNLSVDALAHGCNTQGIMNAGIAKEFKERYPVMYKEYRDYCRTRNFNVGDIHFYRSRDNKPHVVNVAVQFDTNSVARLEYVEAGLKKIEDSYKNWGIKNLGMPHIGCGLGSLKWEDVKEIVKRIFGTSNLEVLIASERNSL